DAFWFDGNQPLHRNLVSIDNTITDSDGDRLLSFEDKSKHENTSFLEERIVTASNEELEHYAKLIRLEQGKRVELNLKTLF
ncbi:MAG: hypothetical protein RLZZ04_2874, partial [Cyanobacteriota bacterium]